MEARSVADRLLLALALRGGSSLGFLLAAFAFLLVAILSAASAQNPVEFFQWLKKRRPRRSNPFVESVCILCRLRKIVCDVVFSFRDLVQHRSGNGKVVIVIDSY